MTSCPTGRPGFVSAKVDTNCTGPEFSRKGDAQLWVTIGNSASDGIVSAQRRFVQPLATPRSTLSPSSMSASADLPAG